ncbi:MAG: type 4a pilus biogenesis protein PilO [Planctomycetes bacterium]|nr:type 4a pilus biogenesis protein PilO [Planctomycetota bacterium]
MLICKKPKIFDVDVIAAGLIMGLCAATWLVLIKPLNEKTFQLRQESQEQIDSTQSAQSELDQLKGLTQQEQDLASWLKQTKNILPTDLGISAAVRTLEDLCQQSGLRLDEVVPGETAAGQHFNKTNLSMQIAGSFPQIQNLLVKIKQKMQHVRIGNMTLNIQNSRLNLCEINMVLDIFSEL